MSSEYEKAVSQARSSKRCAVQIERLVTKGNFPKSTAQKTLCPELEACTGFSYTIVESTHSHVGDPVQLGMTASIRKNLHGG